MKRGQFCGILFFFGILSFFIAALVHKSPQPWIFERYSLSCFVLLLFIFISIVFILFIYFSTWGKVRENDSKLILVDATKNIVRYGQLPSALGSKILSEFCKLNDIGYIPLHDQLNKSKLEGGKTHWKYDWHFNETGQRIFFESMFNYFKNIKN